jgi:VanZ family protein
MLKTLKKISIVFVCLFWFLIFYFSHLMMREVYTPNTGWEHGDKVAHLVAFLILSVTGSLAFERHKSVILGLAFYGALIEVLQANYTLTRSGDPYDWLADLVGIGICFGVIALAQRKKPQDGV